ncbi:hypothetical protein ABE10_00165, partial [Bacillus toyonensis]|nr:hypothetical protein [Bacillus toyonensis]
RRQRRAQLMRDVRDEPLLHHRQLSELLDLSLDAVRHRVEGPAERRQLVLAPDRKTNLEVALGEAGAGLRRLDDRQHHRAHGEPGDDPDDADQDRACHPEAALDEQEGLLRVREVVSDVEPVRTGFRDRDLMADDESGVLPPVGLGDRERLPPLLFGAVRDPLDELIGQEVLG